MVLCHSSNAADASPSPPRFGKHSPCAYSPLPPRHPRVYKRPASLFPPGLQNSPPPRQEIEQTPSDALSLDAPPSARILFSFSRCSRSSRRIRTRSITSYLCRLALNLCPRPTPYCAFSLSCCLRKYAWCLLFWRSNQFASLPARDFFFFPIFSRFYFRGGGEGGGGGQGRGTR